MLLKLAIDQDIEKKADRFSDTKALTVEDCRQRLQTICNQWNKKKGSLLFTRDQMAEFDWSNVPQCLEQLWAE